METVRLIISGKVQGVFFRDSTKRKAESLGLRGYARNLPNGDVEVACSGRKDAVEKLIDFCRKGPEMARVDSIKSEKAENPGWEGFSIIA